MPISWKALAWGYELDLDHLSCSIKNCFIIS